MGFIDWLKISLGQMSVLSSQRDILMNNVTNQYLVNGPGEGTFPTKGFSTALNGTILNTFLPEHEAMPTPHDIAISKDGKCIFVAQLRPHRVFKVFICMFIK